MTFKLYLSHMSILNCHTFVFYFQKINDETILLALKQLNQSTSLVQRDCVTLQQRLLNNDTNSIELCMKEVRNGAYNLAKATKMLVTQFQ